MRFNYSQVYHSQSFHRFLFIVNLFALLFPAYGRTVNAQTNTLAIVSAASYGQAVAQECIVSGFGVNLATTAVGATTTPLPTALGGTTIKARDSAGTERLAPLFFVSPNQVNFQIPPGTATGACLVTVTSGAGAVSSVTIHVAAVAPGLFSADASGRGLASSTALRVRGTAQTYEATGRWDTAQNRFVPVPVDPGPDTDEVFLLLYGTGFRKRNQAQPVQARVGGVTSEVTFAGAQGGFIGLDQLNVRVPRTVVNGGEVNLEITVDGLAFNTLRIALMPMPAAGKLFLAMLRPEGSANSPASGYSTLKLSDDEKSAVVRFSYSNLTTPETSAHIHGPADPGTNGNIVFDLDTAVKQADGSMTWTITQAGATTSTQILQALKSGRMYINIHSAKYPSGEIRGHYGALAGSQTFTPPPDPPAITLGKPTANDAARFLAQATAGPRASDIAALQNQTLDAWINDQFTKPVASHWDYLVTAQNTSGKERLYQEEMMESFWKQLVTGPDQLRQRVSFALGEILVVSFNSSIEGEPYAMAAYIDTLNRDAFGNFRQILEDITLSPAMGRYLDHLQNDKENPTTGLNPNENYAREVLQLFSIGLYKLHPDGSLVLDANGLPIATYDQEVIRGFAKVFTGWGAGGLTKTEQNWMWPPFWTNWNLWKNPMQAWPDHHSTSAKKLLNGVTLATGQTAEKDLKDALDNIFNHQNVGPFIAKQLIQRLVTSNPSPGYVYRVATKFNNNGSGVRGDLKAVIRAMLLDYEARSPLVIANQGYGKLREPILRMSHLLRAFNFTCTCGYIPLYWMDSPEYALGQNPMRSPTVFNFFEPGYTPPGHIAAAGLVAPEFQITNETSTIGFSNFMAYVINDGFKWEASKPLIGDYSALAALAGTPAQMIEQLNLVMLSGQMSATLKDALTRNITQIAATDPVKRAKVALHMVITSPEYMAQK
ncbi:MAG: DUF1800 family protein [Blastocatellia bacterium]